ncbi:HAMP domain-containing histidine kinase [bacterium]|nr:HAMP domain-containing histidine kinase [bacterium]
MTAEMRSMLSAIREGGEVMRKIVRDFIDFQALQDGRLTLQAVRLDVNALARQARLAHEGYARSKNIRVLCELENGLPDVSVDPDRIQQVLANLLGNAIKFSPPGARVTLRSRREGQGVCLEVADEGPGLSPADLERVFVKYARLSAKPTGGEKSSGLGLSIAKMLVELHGGRIGVFNNPDRGATFWFTLP